MNLIQRIGFYGAGFVVGLIILFFFLGGKKASCDYGFDARTLKNIRTKNLEYSPEGAASLTMLRMDTTHINQILREGDVDFSETDRNLDSCKIYLINGVVTEQRVRLRIENCDKIATIQSIERVAD